MRMLRFYTTICVHLQVSLINEKAEVAYNPKVTTVQQVLQTIQGCGFTAKLDGNFVYFTFNRIMTLVLQRPQYITACELRY